MIVSGRERLAAAPDDLRAVLARPDRLVEVLPNVDAFSWLVDDDTGAFTATIRPAIALGEIPIRTTWRRIGSPTASAATVTYAVDGRTDEHWLGLEITVALAADADGTLAEWHADCRFTGTMRTAGQRVVGAVVAHQARVVLQAAARAARS
jgi:carbon monoxide dehydrogenase subunit G